MRHHHTPHRTRPSAGESSKSHPDTSLIRAIERAFYEILEEVDDAEEALQEFTAGPRQKRWDD